MMNTTRVPVLAVLLVSTLAVSGCARQISADSYEGPAAGQIARTYPAVVENVRVVAIQENDTLNENRTGQLLGGVTGGFIGSAFGEGLGQAAAIAAGTIIGTIVGSAAEQELSRQQAMEYIVRDEAGDLYTIVQGMEPALSVGQPVFVQEGVYGRSRIIPEV